MLLSVMQDSLSLKAADINLRVMDQYPEWEELIKVIVTNDPELIETDCVVSRIEELSLC